MLCLVCTYVTELHVCHVSLGHSMWVPSCKIMAESSHSVQFYSLMSMMMYRLAWVLAQLVAQRKITLHFPMYHSKLFTFILTLPHELPELKLWFSLVWTEVTELIIERANSSLLAGRSSLGRRRISLHCWQDYPNYCKGGYGDILSNPFLPI